MSDEMAGSIEIYTQGYDKGFKNGENIGYLKALQAILDKISPVIEFIRDEAANEQ